MAKKLKFVLSLDVWLNTSRIQQGGASLVHCTVKRVMFAVMSAFGGINLWVVTISADEMPFEFDIESCLAISALISTVFMVALGRFPFLKNPSDVK